MSAARVIIHRGLCGVTAFCIMFSMVLLISFVQTSPQVSLRTQCLGIAATYTFISCLGVFLSGLRLHSPGSYVRLEQAVTSLETNATTNTSTEEDLTPTDELEAITDHLIRQVGHNAIYSEFTFR